MRLWGGINKALVLLVGYLLKGASSPTVIFFCLVLISRIHPYMDLEFLPGSKSLKKILEGARFRARVTNTGAIHFYSSENVFLLAGGLRSYVSLKKNYENYVLLKSSLIRGLVDYELGLHSTHGVQYYRMDLLSGGGAPEASRFDEYARILKKEWVDDQFSEMDFSSGLALVERICAENLDLPRPQRGYKGFMHGDFSAGNLMRGKGGGVAVIDLDRCSLQGAPVIDEIHRDINSRELLESRSWLSFIHEYFFFDGIEDDDSNNTMWAYFLFRVGHEGMIGLGARYKVLLRTAVRNILAKRRGVIAFVAPAGVTGGVGAVVAELAEAINSRCDRETVKVFDDFSTLLYARNIQAIHSHGLWSLIHVWAFFVALYRRVPYVISPHGMLDPWAVRHKRLKKVLAFYLYQRWILNCASLVIVNSDREIEQVAPYIKGQVPMCIGNGVNFTGAPAERRPDAVFGQAIFLSRINPVKGVTQLLLAWSRSKAVHKYGYRLNIYGEADDQRYMEDLIDLRARLGLVDIVEFKGGVYGADKWEAYLQHDFFVLPSFGENFAIVVAEALYAGLFVITSKWTPWAQLQSMGFGVQVGDLDSALVKAIDDAVECANVLSRESMIKASRAYAVESFSWPNIAREYLKVYKHNGIFPVGRRVTRG